MGEAVVPDHLGECNTADVSVIVPKGLFFQHIVQFHSVLEQQKIKVWILLCAADPQAQDTFKYTS